MLNRSDYDKGDVTQPSVESSYWPADGKPRISGLFGDSSWFATASEWGVHGYSGTPQRAV